MTVSVVIPLYNKAHTINRALHSVLAQTCQDFEVIVVNDGSMDGSGQVVERLADPRIRLISQPNAGPGAARNRGAAEARGQFFAFLDADDEWEPTFLERCVEVLTQNPDCGFCVTAFHDGPSRRHSQQHLDTRAYRPGRYEITPATNPTTFDWLLYAYLPSTAVFRAEAFRAAGGFYQKNRCTYGEDMYLFVSAAVRFPFYRLGDPLAWYHTEDSQLARQLVLTPLMSDPDPLLAACPEKNLPVLRGALADRALQEALRFAYAGHIGSARELLARFEAAIFYPSRVVGALRQISTLRLFPGLFLRWFGPLVSRVLGRLFPV